MIVDQVKKQRMDAMKARDEITKSILGVALGDMQLQEARDGKPTSDEFATQVIRKLIKSNQETMASSRDDDTRHRLEKEIQILSVLLPQTLDVDQIIAALAPVTDAIKSAGNDGQATGQAMKHLKSNGAVVEGKDVSEAVKRIRA